MPKKKIHLICNAHLDPVWLWRWEEGVAEALSTFRNAADLCEKYDGFIFNHNEAILYKWVEENEPALFRRIQKLVRKKKWHIMGGMFLQPDCNMPSGESFVRQILVGKRYFRKKFNTDVSTAINFDPFGHSCGLVQILAKSGYNSYLFCRPRQIECHLPGEEFIWVGHDGSEILGVRVPSWYESGLGRARQKIEVWMKDNPDKKLGVILWGVGNHGGGPSRNDLNNIGDLIRSKKDVEIVHSTPEAYFKELAGNAVKLPRWNRDLNPSFIGCYSSMIRIKQKHRLLENELYSLEKMISTAAFQNLINYPQDELNEALEDLLYAEFHDVLPGSSIQAVEEDSLQRMDHGLEIVSRLKARAFFAFASGQPKADEGEIPILVYNPHPHKIKTILECEFQLATSSEAGRFVTGVVYRNGKPLPSQIEKEESNILIDWRKKVVFYAELEPGTMNRFDCRLKTLKNRPRPKLKEKNGKISFKTKELEVVVNAKTGLVDRYRVKGVDYVGRGAFQPLVMMDNDDSWRLQGTAFRKVAGKFRLMSAAKGTEFSGVSIGKIKSVRVVEDGEARSIIEAVLAYNDSFICMCYKLPKHGTEIEVEVRVFWNEKSRMLKLQVPFPWKECRYIGQVACGVDELPAGGAEAVAQKWVGVISEEDDRALTCVNDGIYASDCSKHGLRLTLLRSPAYSAHFIEEGRPLTLQDRFSPRMDQGERLFRLFFNGGKVAERLRQVETEALSRNEKPFALSFFPSGAGAKPKGGARLTGGVVQMSCMKKAEGSDDLIVRLFEPTGTSRKAMLSIPFIPLKMSVALSGFEIKTLRIDPKTRKFSEVDLLERS